jgi:hypothetical protein
LLWAAKPTDRVQPRPYLRVDLRPGLTLADDPAYYQGIEDAMAWWLGAPRAPLTIVVGNEFNLLSEGGIQPRVAGMVVGAVVARRDARFGGVRVAAPAVGPWNRDTNPDDLADFYPGPSSEWRNCQFALAKHARASGHPPDCYALHVYGASVVPSVTSVGYWANEPFVDYYVGDRPSERAGSRVWRDLREATFAGDPGRGYQFAVTEANCRWPNDRPSRVNYCQGWLPNLLADLALEPRLEAVAWFAGDSSAWPEDSLRARAGVGNPGGGCAAADDDWNRVVLDLW